MSIIRVNTGQGIKRVKIAGDQPTPEEVELIKAEYEIIPAMNEMGGTQTMPMTPTLPEEPPEPAPPPELKPEYMTPEEQEMARQRATQMEAYNKGDPNRRSPFAADPQESSATVEQLANTAFGVGKGAGVGLGHMVKTALAIVPENSIVDAIGQVSPYADRSDIADSSDSPLGTQDLADSMESKLREIPREDGFAGLAQTMTQFAVPYLTARSVGAPSPVASFVAGASGFDTQTERLSNILRDGTVMGLELKDPLTEYLAYKPGSDDMLDGALKNGIEMGVLDAGVALTFLGAIKAYRTVANAGKKGQNPQKVLDKLKRDPNYDKQLQLHDAVNFADQPNAKTSPLPPLGKTKVLVNKGVKVKVDQAKEQSKHAREYSEETAIRLQKAADARVKRNKEAGFIKLGVDDIADTPIVQIPKALKSKFDSAVQPLKTQIIKAHPQFGPRVSTLVDHFELEQNILAFQAYRKLEPGLKSFERMKIADQKLFDSAYKNKDIPKLYDIARRYENGVFRAGANNKSLGKIKIPGFQQKLEDTLLAFEEMHQLGTQNGIKMGKIKNYLPLQIRDFAKFRRAIGRTDDPLLIEIEQEMKAFAARNIDDVNKLRAKNGDAPIDPKDLTINYDTGVVDFQGVRYQNLELSPYAKEKIALNRLNLAEAGGTGQPKGADFTLQRTVKMSPEVEPHYHGFAQVVSQYPKKWAYEIAHNRFQGKIPGMEHQGYKNVMMKMAKDLDIPEGAAREEIARLVKVRLRAGEKVLSLKSGQQNVLDNVFKGYRDFVYLTTLGNPFSTLTQSSELFLNAYRNGVFNNITGTKTAIIDNLPKFMKSAFNRTDKGMRMSDLGLLDIGAEYQGAGQGFISKIPATLLNGGKIKGVKIPGAMNLAGFKRMDFIMKESNLNGALLKARKQLRTAKGEKAFRDKMSPYYQEQTDDLIKGIKSGKKDNDLTKLYLYQELAKTQPISLSEMPQVYLQSGGPLKSMYFLKSFGLKQLETMRRDVFRQIASGNKKKAVYNLFSISLLFGGGIAGQNYLKDFILDRNREEWTTHALEAGLNLHGLSRFQFRKFDTEDWPDALAQTFLPPTPVMEKIGQDDFFKKTQKNWPLFGKYLYWKDGYGKDVIRKDREKQMRKKGIPLPPRPPKPPAPPKPPNR